MIFISKVGKKEILFEKTDTELEKSIVEHSLALLKTILQRIKEVGGDREN